jgi:hypothetical protein
MEDLILQCILLSYYLTDQLINFMIQKLSQETSSCLDHQEIPCIL